MKKYLIILLICNLPLHAEVITDGTLGKATNLSGPNYQIEATLGQQHGNNLFHSFQDFNLNSSESATFSGTNNIQNIISRVTGGNPSNIDGLIRSTIPNADFYFLNPYGIVFGPNASLDIQGSFHVSTADYLRLGENGKFSASNSEQSLLTVAKPQDFGFFDNNSFIDIQGGFIVMPPEQTLSIIGGDINITDSVLFTPSGQINLVAIKEAEISLNNLQINSFEKLGTITISQSSAKLLQEIGLANIDVSGMPIPDMLPPNIGGQIFIRAGQLILNKGSIFADTYQGSGKNIDILVNDLQLKNGAKITSYNYGNEQGGDINIISEVITLTDLNNEFDDPNDYNPLNIDMKNYNIIGTDNYENGIGGNININTDILSVNHGIVASAVKKGGIAGNIIINAKNEFFLNDISSISTISEEDTIGDAGNISLYTNLLKVNSGEINTFSYGTGESGNIDITADTAYLYKSNFVSENLNSDGGDININVSQTVFTDDMRIISLTEGSNQGGKISINKPQFAILNKSIFDSTSNRGTDGQINIDTNYFIKSVNSTLKGDTVINSGQENFSNSLENSAKIIADASKLLKKSCLESAKDDSHFIVTEHISAASIKDLLESPHHTDLSKITYQSLQEQLDNTNIAEQRAKILSQLATLYASESRYKEALQLNQQALLAIQLLNSAYWNYKLQWQRGRLFKALDEYDNAIIAYKNAIQKLTTIHNNFNIRQDLTQIYKEHYPNGERSEFREILKPIFTELIALLLQLNNLKEVLGIINLLKTAELQDYFQDDCTKDTIDLETVDKKHTAIIYPIFLADSVELLLSLPGEQRFHITLPTTPEQLTETINILANELNCKNCEEIYPLEDKNYLTSAQQIYAWLIRPIEAKLSNEINTLVFVPDGPLYSIPMAVLHDGQQFLIEKYALAIAPSLTMLSTENIFSPRILHSALTESKHPNFNPIRHYFDKMQQELENIFAVTTLKGKDFITANLEQELNITPYSTIHIFSHAQFSKQVDNTFIVTFDDKLSMEKLEKLINPQKYSDTPLDLLTLSACETATGDERAALGLAGIAYKAGTRSAVATLWNIREEIAFDFFKYFYRELPNNKAEAVQIAQLKLLNYYHPHYWSPFLLIGSWLK